MDHTVKHANSVHLFDLIDNTTILAYVGFPEQYHSMEQHTCQWVQHNFKGVQADITRDQIHHTIPVEELKEGDTLVRLHHFPDTLKKLTVVTPKLTKELKSRQFFHFEIAPRKDLTLKKENREKAISEANTFIESVSKGIAVREETTEAIENTFDDARAGKISISRVVEFVNSIVADSSVDAMAAIANLKESDQTYAHCVDVGVIFQSLYYKIIQRRGVPSAFQDKEAALLGAFLHDFGKSKIPKDILDSTVRFERDSPEMKLMQEHPVESGKLLLQMGMPDSLVNMATYHHVKMDIDMASSYPKVPIEKVLWETRLLALVDVYQALIGKRSYKKSWAPPAAVRYIEALAGTEFDQDIFSDFVSSIGRYPRGSLVELNNGALAFVISVPVKDLGRPRVVVVKNANEENITHHDLIDLKEEKEINIVKEVDQYEALGDKGLEIFCNMRIS